MDKTSGGTVTKIAVYYPVGGAMRINGTLYFILKDNLGSSSVVTDASGTIAGEDRFYPYGETRFTTGSMNTDKLFTGQREMTGLGIYHYGARFYSPKLGRFLSPDTLIPSYVVPQYLNRYSYVLGNPLRYTDPTGHVVACNEADGDVCEHEDSGSTNNNSNPGKNNDPNDPTDEADDPNPLGLPAPQPLVCSSSICDPHLTGPFPPTTTSTGTPSESSFWRGVGLMVAGTAVTIIGGVFIGAAIAEVVVGVPTGPLEALVVLHALAVGGAGLGLALIGTATIRKGFEVIESSQGP